MDLLKTLRELLDYDRLVEEESRDQAVRFEEGLSERARSLLIEIELRAPLN